MKKRTIAIAAAFLLAVVAVPTIAFANAMPVALSKAPAAMQEPQAVEPVAERTAAACAGFADADNDGVCDNCGAAAQGTHHRGYVDADGVCDNYAAGTCPGNGNGCGAYGRGGYVDADGDGVCDNYGTARGAGTGQGYVDANGDGVCDNYAAGACPGNGQGNGCGNGGACGQGAGQGQARGGHHGRGC